MAEYKDRVKDQTNTTGTGTVTIDGVAANGYRTITSAHTTGATVRYTIVNVDGSQWETGEGVWTASGATLTRATVYASSNSGSLVNFSAGAKAVFTGPVAQDLTEALPTTGGTMTGRLKLDTVGQSTTFFINGATAFGFVTHLASNTTTTYSADNGLTGSALFGNLSQPIISNSGVGGSNGNVVYGASFIPQIASSGASALIGAYGVQGFAERSNAADVSTNSGNALHGGFFTARHTTALANATLSGTITALTGSTLVQGGTATNAYGVFSTGNVGSSNAANNTVAVTNFYQFFGNTVNVGSAANSYGTITNYYGLYLSSPTVNARGTITNRYGVYQADTLGINYLAGNLIVNAPLGFGAVGTPSYGTSGHFLKSGGNAAAPSWGALSSGEVTTALGYTPINPTAIGVSVQAYDADLAAIAALAPTADNFIVGNGTAWTLETPAQARASLGGTTVGQNLFTLTNPSAVTFPRINADNTVSALDAATFRSAIGAGTSSTTGTVTSVGGTGTVSGLTLTGTVTGSGNLTLGGTLSLTSGQVTTALGFTPYNSTNPSGYITSSSLSSYLALSGGTMTGQITTKVTTGTSPSSTTGGSDSLQIMGNGTNGAFLSLHRSGAYAVNFGLDTSNVVSIGGWSDGANYRWQVDASGNFTARGNVTAYSDERLKKDWSDLPADFIERLAKVKHGTYTRIDSGERQVGISAQGLLAVLQEAVMKDGKGNLSVAYGNAALTAAVQLAARVVALETRLTSLEA